MKTTLLTGITVVMVMLSTSVFADKDHHKDKNSQQSMSGMMRSGGGMSMIDMEAMHKHMAKMQKTMGKIHNTKDVKERQELMQQHMQEMHKGMGMMQGMMSGDTMGSMEMMNEKGEMPDMKFMMKRHMMMEKRMDLMQGMMGQMMEHMKQQQSMGMEKR